MEHQRVNLAHRLKKITEVPLSGDTTSTKYISLSTVFVMGYGILTRFSGSIISTLMSLRASEFCSLSQLPSINDRGSMSPLSTSRNWLIYCIILVIIGGKHEIHGLRNHGSNTDPLLSVLGWNIFCVALYTDPHPYIEGLCRWALIACKLFSTSCSSR